MKQSMFDKKSIEKREREREKTKNKQMIYLAHLLKIK